jgi:hypothetical protein
VFCSAKSVSLGLERSPSIYPYLRVADHIQERNDIGPASQILQDLDFSLDLLLLDGLEDLDYALLVVNDVDAFEDFGVFPSSCTPQESATKYAWLG